MIQSVIQTCILFFCILRAFFFLCILVLDYSIVQIQNLFCYIIFCKLAAFLSCQLFLFRKKDLFLSCCLLYTSRCV